MEQALIRDGCTRYPLRGDDDVEFGPFKPFDQAARVTEMGVHRHSMIVCGRQCRQSDFRHELAGLPIVTAPPASSLCAASAEKDCSSMSR